MGNSCWSMKVLVPILVVVSCCGRMKGLVAMLVVFSCCGRMKGLKEVLLIESFCELMKEFGMIPSCELAAIVAVVSYVEVMRGLAPVPYSKLACGDGVIVGFVRHASNFVRVVEEIRWCRWYNDAR